MKPEYYADEYRKYETFMADWENTGGLMRIASGAADADYNWTETRMKNIPLNMLGCVAMHHYSVIEWTKKGPAVDFTEAQYFATITEAIRMDSLVTNHAAIMDKYHPLKKMSLVVDEWGCWYDVEPGTNPGFLYQQNTMRDAMMTSVTLNRFNNHADRIPMANLAQCVNLFQAVILTNKEKMILKPTYHVMKMYNVHQDAIRLPVKVATNDYVLNGHRLPAVSASVSKDSTGPIDMPLVNIDGQNTKNNPYGLITVLQSSDPNNVNSFTAPQNVAPKESTIAINGKHIDLVAAPYSFSVIRVIM